MGVDHGLRIHWEKLLRRSFPNGADLKVDPTSSDFKARVSWKVGTDPVRPNKISKLILVVVPGETADDYGNKPAERRKSDDLQLQKFIQAKLATHDPDHHRPKSVSPPEVQWVACSDVLNS